MDNSSVVYDACVLYPAPLRDVLMSLAVTRLFQAHWTEAIHNEWTRNLLQARPDIPPEQLERTCRLMNKAIPDSVVTGYEGLINTLILPDRDDRHVLAAAIHSKSQMIITFNVKDFPATTLSDYGIEACHPDNFVAQLFDGHTVEVITALQKQRQRLTHPPQPAEDFLETLSRQGLRNSVNLLRRHIASL